MEQISKDHIKSLALANGFSLKKQPDNSMDLNPYVYDFAAKVAEHGARLHFIAGIQCLAASMRIQLPPHTIALAAIDYIPFSRVAECTCSNLIEQHTGDGMTVLFCSDCGQNKAGGAQ